jgi:hypothetical protein
MNTHEEACRQGFFWDVWKCWLGMLGMVGIWVALRHSSRSNAKKMLKKIAKVAISRPKIFLGKAEETSETNGKSLPQEVDID